MIKLAVPTDCRFCGNKVLLQTQKEFYGRDYGKKSKLYVCMHCKARVGTHPGTDHPLGTLADEETRTARMEAHRSFDPLWKSKTMKRRAAYEWLAGELRIPTAECHISWFEPDRCQRVVEVVTERNGR